MIVLLMLGMAVGAAAGSTATARAHLGSGNQLMQAERYAEAADEFQKALGDDHTLTKARDQLAICYFELRDYAHARPLLEQMRLDKNSAGVAAYYLGRIELAQDNPVAAWAMCRPLAETDDVGKIAAIGMLFGEAKQYRPALEAWQKAAALDPDSSEIQYNFALTCFHLKDMLRAREHAV